MYDISHYFTDKEFVLEGTFVYEDGTEVEGVVGILQRGQNPGRESGKGLTSAVRAIEANFSIINFQQLQLTDEPTVHSKYTVGETIWDILSSEDVGSGFWRCEAKKMGTVNARGRFKR